MITMPNPSGLLNQQGQSAYHAAAWLPETLKQGEGSRIEFKSSLLIPGVRQVIDTFVAYGLPEPEFEATQGGMAVTVFKTPVATTKEIQPESQPEYGLSLEAKVLRLLGKASMSKRDISAALGQKEVSGQLNKIIRALLSRGLIEATISEKTNSRLQQYRIAAK